ncbi:DUF1854 domain-containing protein [Candidatus Poribacteria bacterium]|nr:DUF1854 domain-containing protein [Candidatus Poribacteria bacterium]
METAKIEDEVKPLDAKSIKIYRNELDDLVIELPDGSKHAKVRTMRAFPLSNPGEFIILRDKEDNEVGLIENINELNSKYKKVLEEELQKSYFIPQITKIKNLEEKFGISEWEVETNKGAHTFNVRNREEVRLFSSGRVLIKDADGNRYEIPDYRRLDPKSIAFLETEM